jgi:Tol biopolymer transport system component
VGLAPLNGPDGSNLQQLTKSPGNDAHAVWTDDGKNVMWSTRRYGFKDEAALYNNNPQPYASIEGRWLRAAAADG